MFRKLRLKLTLMNVAVTGLILLFLISGIYVMMLESISRQSEQLMWLIASDEGSGTLNQIREQEKHRFNYFYAKTNSTGQ